MILKRLSFDQNGATKTEEAVVRVYCRVYRNIFNISLFQNSTALMTANHQYSERAQQYALLKYYCLCAEKWQKSIQNYEFHNLYIVSLHAITEEERSWMFWRPQCGQLNWAASVRISLIPQCWMERYSKTGAATLKCCSSLSQRIVDTFLQFRTWKNRSGSKW